MAMDITKAITPPNLLGIERRMAYANKKYHSGWMWIGVTRGFAGVKLSGSPKRLGAFNTNKVNILIIIKNPTKSFNVKYGLNGILSIFLWLPIGFIDPVWCKKSKWIIIKAETIKGSIKCSAKNRVNVALSTANPPQIHCTIKLPKYGIAETKFVITVAPQKDICPQGRT